MYLGDTIIAIIVINLVMQVIWLGGVHGASIVNAVFLTVWMNYLEANAAAQSTNSVMPHITSLPFYQWYIWIGGSGATLALVILMLFSKNEFIKDLGRISILPGICNINEPIIYGLPIVMNPIMALPFIFTPIITGVISYVIVDLGLITRFFTMVPWTLPAPIGGFLASGGDYRAVILIFLNILIAGIIYFPFLKSYERSLEKKEQVNE